MSDTATRTCTECGNLQSDGDFCERCGAQFPPTVRDTGFTSAAPPVVPVEPDTSPLSVPPTSASASAPAPSSAAAEPVPAVAESAAPLSPPPSAGGPPFSETPPVQPPLPPPVQPAGATQESAQQTAYAAPAYQQVPPPPPPSGAPQGGAYGTSPPPGDRGSGFFETLFDFSFTEFVTPRIIKSLFIITLVLIGLGVLTMIVTGFAFGVFTGLFTLLIVAPLAALFYVLIARLWLEVVVVLFRVEEHLAELVKKD